MLKNDRKWSKLVDNDRKCSQKKMRCKSQKCTQMLKNTREYSTMLEIATKMLGNHRKRSKMLENA